MRLFELAVGSRIYASLGYDKSYKALLDSTLPALNLNDDGHLTALLSWLRKWGCRQFETDSQDEAVAKNNIRTWAAISSAALPPPGVALTQLSLVDIAKIEASFERLSSGKACRRKSIGPVGAAKILFAIRPNSCPPWDKATRQNGESYSTYLARVQEDLLDVLSDAKEIQLDANSIPATLKRTQSSLAKLADEYYFAFRTNPCPTKGEVAHWYQWSQL